MLIAPGPPQVAFPSELLCGSGVEKEDGEVTDSEEADEDASLAYESDGGYEELLKDCAGTPLPLPPFFAAAAAPPSAPLPPPAAAPASRKRGRAASDDGGQHGKHGKHGKRGGARRWTPEEDAMLTRAVAENRGAPDGRSMNGIRWVDIKERALAEYPLLVNHLPPMENTRAVMGSKALSKRWCQFLCPADQVNKDRKWR